MNHEEMAGYKEKAEHGDALMPVRLYRCQVPFSYQNLALHWHEEVEVTRIQRGAIHYDVNFSSFAVTEGDLLLISPHTLHAAREIKGREMISDTLVFHLDMLGCRTPDACSIKYLNPVQTGKYRFVPVVRPEDPGHGELSACFLEAVESFEERAEGYELMVKELLLRLFRLLYRYGYVVKNEGSGMDSELEEKLKGVLSYIQKNYGRAISVGELAGVCHFSEVHFMNFFKKFAGMTCVEYINRYRLSRAAALLAGTSKAVTDIAMENGFCSVSYFNRLFKRRFQMTPGEYRRQNRRLGS